MDLVKPSNINQEHLAQQSSFLFTKTPKGRTYSQCHGMQQAVKYNLGAKALNGHRIFGMFPKGFRKSF